MRASLDRRGQTPVYAAANLYEYMRCWDLGEESWGTMAAVGLVAWRNIPFLQPLL